MIRIFQSPQLKSAPKGAAVVNKSHVVDLQALVENESTRTPAILEWLGSNEVACSSDT